MDFMFLVGLPFRGAFQLSLTVLVHYRYDTELFSLGSTARPIFSQHSQAGLLAGKSRLLFVVRIVEGRVIYVEAHVTPVVYSEIGIPPQPQRANLLVESPSEGSQDKAGAKGELPKPLTHARNYFNARLPMAYSSPGGFRLGLLPFRSRLLRESS